MNKLSFLVTLGLMLLSVSTINPKTVVENKVESKNTQSVERFNNEDTSISYGTETNNLVFRISTFSETTTSKSISVYVGLSDEITDDKKNFYIGYYEEADKQYPAKLVYDITYSNGEKQTLSSNIIKKNTNGKYDGIGDYLGSTTLNTFCDITCPYGSTIDKSSIKLINVFEADIKKEDGVVVSRLPIYDNPYYVSATLSPSVANYKFNDFLELEYDNVSTFSGYTSVRVNAISHGKEMYQNLRGSAYRKYKDQIDSGAFYIRTRLSFSGDSSFVLTFKDGTVQNQSTISSNIELSNDYNSCYLLVKDLNMNNLVNFELYNVYINLGLYNNEAYKEVSGSNISIAIRFNTINIGFVDVVDKSNNVIIAKVANRNNIDYNAVLIIAMVVFAVIYVAIVLFFYFYLKNKNKNDEFKKMRTGQYFKTASIGFVFIGSLILSLLTIIGRVNFLNNSFAVYNPLDVYIIAFSVVSLILFGYFVRYFWIMFKNNREKKRLERLKINLDVIDDGTLLTKKR